MEFCRRQRQRPAISDDTTPWYQSLSVYFCSGPFIWLMVKILKPVILAVALKNWNGGGGGGMWKRRQHDRQKGGPIVLTGVSSQLQMSSSRSSRNSIWSNGELPVLFIRVLDIVEEASRISLPRQFVLLPILYIILTVNDTTCKKNKKTYKRSLFSCTRALYY